MSMLCVLATVWCLNNQCWIPPQGFNSAAHVQELAKDPDLWIIAGIESRYDRDAVSSAGAKGLFQIMPIAERHVNQLSNLKLDRDNMLDNITIASIYWRYLVDRYGGDVVLALVAYQWGPSNADRFRQGVTALPGSTALYIKQFMEIKNKCEY